MNAPLRHDDCEVAVIGAGPYGLAAAAHLRAANIETRVIGKPMSFWRDNMPRGMKLRSPWIASHIADPARKFSLDVFARKTGLDPVEDQLPIEQFIDYGEWFQRHLVSDLDCRQVVRVEDAGGRFFLVLDDGNALRARRLVVAMGLARQDFRPLPFQGLPAALVSHSCEHSDLGKWKGLRVAVVGRGQSACESAALLSEAGSEVDLICRGEIRWVGAPKDQAGRSWLRRLRGMLQAPSAVGGPPFDWLNELPGIERALPAETRNWISRRSLRPACAWWVQPHFKNVKVRANRSIVQAQAAADRIEIRLDDKSYSYDHVLLATGYKIDIARLGILSPALLQKIHHVDGSPVLTADFESTMPRLHFVGASSVNSFGPLMRFIAGAGYAARRVARAASADRASAGRASLRTSDREFAPEPAKSSVRSSASKTEPVA